MYYECVCVKRLCNHSCCNHSEIASVIDLYSVIPVTGRNHNGTLIDSFLTASREVTGPPLTSIARSTCLGKSHTG